MLVSAFFVVIGYMVHFYTYSNFFIGIPISKPLEKTGFVLIASRFAIRPNWGLPFLLYN